MKRKAIALLAVCLMISGCKTDTSETQSPNDTIVSGTEQIYTSDTIYVTSYNCGYISPDCYPPEAYIFIETQEQLDFAEERYRLKAPDGLTEQEISESYPLSVYIQRMKESFPLSEHNYFFTYDEVSSGGYRLHTDRVVISGDEIHFEMDDGSFTPEEGSVQPAVMGGFFHIAAVPKKYCKDTVFTNVIYPDRTDLTQDKNYSYQVKYSLAGTELHELYGDSVYLLNSRTEFDDFLNKASEIKDFNPLSLENNYDFDKISVAVVFFERSQREFIRRNTARVEDGSVFIDYEFMEIDEYDKNKTESGAIIITVPKTFLK